MYLTGCTLYTTLEPCPMCTAALVNERVARIVFAAYDRRYGACGSVFDLANSIHLNHKIEVKGGILEEEASMLMKRFFEKLREDD
jgi:tRNA(adenine34) deaminase